MSHNIQKTSVYLNFESNGGIYLQKIDKSNPKYNRCIKALNDNTEKGFFKDQRLLLGEVFKIENHPQLTKFETCLKKEK